MPSIKSTKQRIKSVKNIAQITKAMEMVSATKMRRSQLFALSARPYATASLLLLKNLLARAPLLPPLLQKRRKESTALLVVIASDKGLAGGFNAHILKKADAWIAARRAQSIDFRVVAIGKKAKEHCERRGVALVRSWTGLGDYAKLAETIPIANFLMEGFLARAWDGVEIVYTNFRSTLAQEQVVKKILPATMASIEDAVRSILPERGRFAYVMDFEQTPRYRYTYAFEPSSAAILETLATQLIRVHLYHTILESNASEHSARMMAMKNASDNAAEIITDLARAYNQMRQAGITRELTEIITGAEALET